MSSQTTSKALPILIVLVVCCCVSSVTAGGLWAGNVFCDTTNPDDQAAGMNCAAVYERSPGPAPAPAPGPAPAPAPGPAPAATDPRSTVWSSGQLIQSAPVLISVAAPPTPTNQPTGLTAGAVATSYTISLDINTSGKGASWFRVYGADPHPGFPGIWIMPIAPAVPATKVIRVHFGGGHEDIPMTTTVPFNSYFNLVAVYDSVARTGTLYLNGTQVVSQGSMPAFNWPSPLNNMNFNGALPPKTDITVRVGNVYWWNSTLTATQIAKLSIPSSPTPGVATTSYYMPDPYTAEKDFAGY